MLLARIFLTLFPYLPKSSIAPGLSNSILCSFRAVVVNFLLVDQHWHVRVYGFHQRTSFMILSLLLHLRPANLVRLTWMLLEMGGKWQYNCCFVGCCFQELSNIIRSILLQFSPSFFFMRFVSVHEVYPLSSIHTATAVKKTFFIFRYPTEYDYIDVKLLGSLGHLAKANDLGVGIFFFKFKTWGVLFRRICDSLVHHSSIISSS